VVEVIELEREGVDGKRCGEGPHVEMWPRAPRNLKTALSPELAWSTFQDTNSLACIDHLLMEASWVFSSNLVAYYLLPMYDV